MAAHQFHVAGMTSRRCVRAISGCVSDVPGVRTVEAQLDAGTLRVTGTAPMTAVVAAIRRAGYDVIAPADGTAQADTGDQRSTGMEVEP